MFHQESTPQFENYNDSSVQGLPIALAEPVALDYNNVMEKHKQQLPSRNNKQFSTTPPLTSGTHRSLSKGQLNMLTAQGFTKGLAQSLIGATDTFAKRIWIVDNSGSMQRNDGHRIMDTNNSNTVHVIPCTRWEEICECVKYHIQLANTLDAPTSFRLLNDPGARVGSQQFDVASAPGTGSGTYEAQEALSIMRKVQPGGCTPLTSHILDIHAEVSRMAPELRQNGKRVAIIIATDGLPTDCQGYGGKSLQNEFVNSLRKLEGLPVWVVIRLCTDDEDVVEFYNELDSVLELSVEVLDDFCGEAQEVYAFNPWLNYTLALHRMREMGYHDRIFDMLDERKLTKTELRDFCVLLFGEDKFYDGCAPDPWSNWNGFVSYLENLLQSENHQWNPIKKRSKPLLSTSKLNRSFGESSLIKSFVKVFCR